MPYTNAESLFVGILMCALCAPAVAQPPSTNMMNNTPEAGKQVVDELYAGESDDVGPQITLSAKPSGMHLEASGDVQYYHTSNLFLYEDPTNPGINKRSAGVQLATIDLAVTPNQSVLIEGDFQPRFGFRQQWYSFSRERDPALLPPGASRSLDFYTQTLFVEGRYRYDQQWIFSGGVEQTQLSMTKGENNIYSEIVPRWSAQRQIKLDNTRFLVMGYQGAYHATTVKGAVPPLDNVNDRIDHGLFVNYTRAITPQFFVKPYFQYKHTRYSHYIGAFGELSRHEDVHTFGLTGSYYFTPQVSLRAFASYEKNDSSAQGSPGAPGLVYDYQKVDAGIGLNVSHRF